MTKLPPPPPPRKGKDIRPTVKAWRELKEEIAALQAREMTMRKFLFAQLVPSPKEGTNRVIKDGMEIVAKHTVYRNVDKAAYAEHKATLQKKGINVDALIELNPKLVISEYRKLDERRRKIFDIVLSITDGAPSLDINLGT